MQSLNVEQLKSAIISASNNLTNNKERIDALNVFPVPDGDTGSNMSSTIAKACEGLNNNEYKSIGKMMTDVSRDMLLGARGNSGVILSQIFKGFSNAWLKIKDSLTPNQIVEGFESATKTAYSSVLKPIEGTILTVIKETSEHTRKEFKESMSVIDVFELLFKNAQKSVKNTPNILPILKEAGVVDSGGEGLLMIIEGILIFLKEGKPIEINSEKTKQLKFISDTEIYTGEFGYCTELIIRLKNTLKFNKNDFVSAMEKLGNSLVVVQDDDILKIHVHAITPGKVLNTGQKFGEFLTIKVENMTEQANNTKSQADSTTMELDLSDKKGKTPSNSKTRKQIAIISCNTGNGFVDLMNEYECDYIVEGGQSTNPSAQDILGAIEAVNSKNVIILPNNSNIILAAQQAAKLSKKTNIHIVPTKTQVEGITSILNYSPELSLEDNISEINSSLKNLVVGQITKAIRNAKIDGIKVKEGDYLMIKNNKIIGTKNDLIKSSCALVDEMIKSKKHSEILVIYYGNNLSAIEASKIQKYVVKKHEVEVEIFQGDQEIYDFLFGLE